VHGCVVLFWGKGLREAYLQTHLQQPLDLDCRACVSNLGAYVRDGLSARERRRVDEHLGQCTSCPPLLAELTETNTHLRAALIPLVVGVPAAKYLAGLGGAKGLAATMRRMPRSQQAGVAAAAVAAIVGLAAIGIAAGRDDHRSIVAAEASPEPSTTLRVTPTTSSATSSATSPASTDPSTDHTDPFSSDTTDPYATSVDPNAPYDSADIFVPTYPSVPYVPNTQPPTTPPPPTPGTAPRKPTTTTTQQPTTTTNNVNNTYPTVPPVVDSTTTTSPATTT
ncbi:MAG TPA: zf-HC2 domain-containing protein, partial [Ilumatobacteraceae bacterium]|nr:zf-HC2 domain-containing protein [Ilumatobacteraceae bacterium]